MVERDAPAWIGSWRCWGERSVAAMGRGSQSSGATATIAPSSFALDYDGLGDPAGLLLSLNLASRWHWGIKASAIAVTTVFFGVSSGFAVDSLQEGRRFELSVPRGSFGPTRPIVIDFRPLLVRQKKWLPRERGPMVRIPLPPPVDGSSTGRRYLGKPPRRSRCGQC
jgi:hypothetical protein